jgi:hypothetical protein
MTLSESNLRDLIFHAQHMLERVGAPGLRDVDAPCPDFEPGTPSGSCETDGHYLCWECRQKGEPPEWFNA